MIKEFLKKLYCKHDYKLTRWRLIHWQEKPLTIQSEIKCNKCGKIVVLFGGKRNKEWEEVNINTKVHEVF
jgi:hypothetical protein